MLIQGADREEHVLLVALQDLATHSFGHTLGESLLFSCTFAWPPSWENGAPRRDCRAWSLIMEHDEQFGSRKIDTTGEFSLLLQISISNHYTIGCADNK